MKGFPIIMPVHIRQVHFLAHCRSREHQTRTFIMKILLIDSHPVVWHGVRHFYATDPDTVVLHASTADQALMIARLEAPDVYLLVSELDGQEGLYVLKRLRKQNRSARILMFLTDGDVTRAHAAVRAGACGCVTKSATREDLLEAVKRASEGKPFMDQELVQEIFRRYANFHLTESTLAGREKEILRLLSKGRRVTEIASQLGVAPKTISNALTQIRGKLNLPKASELLHHSVEWDAQSDLTGLW